MFLYMNFFLIFNLIKPLFIFSRNTIRISKGTVFSELNGYLRNEYYFTMQNKITLPGSYIFSN